MSPAAGQTVCAVVVTYERRELLRECLSALEAQTRPPDRVLVVDNASRDGTSGMVREDFGSVDLLPLAENLGGAGGFHAGLKAARGAGADWIWLMDDDTIPSPDALAELLSAPDRLDGFPVPLLLASKAVWTDGRLHPMNLPVLERRRVERTVESCGRGLMPIRTATFVSLLVAGAAVDRYGLPLKHYFIWSDDYEYTARVLRRESGYLVPQSVVHHKTKTAHSAVSDSGERFYYHVRNTLFMLRSQAWDPWEKLTLVWALLATTAAYLRHNRLARANIGVVIRGLRDGVRPGT